MDIRIINKKDEIINVTNLSIMCMDKWLVGMNDEGEIVRIEEHESKEEGRKQRENNKIVYGSVCIHSAFR